MAGKVAIGIQDYSVLIENKYFYIDKTSFIKEWWESGYSVTLINRPRRFGKTLNISMTEQFFSVDYARCENLQYEDDEYYYYVKAVPKLSVATPEKTVKRISERQETEIIDAAEVRKRTGKKAKPPVKKSERADAPAGRRRSAKKGPAAKRHDMEEVDKMLLTQSLRKDLNLK